MDAIQALVASISGTCEPARRATTTRMGWRPHLPLEQPGMDRLHEDRVGDDEDHADEEGNLGPERERYEDDGEQGERRPEERDEHETR